MNEERKKRIWKKRKSYLRDPEKPRGYLVGIAGWMPGDKLNDV